MNVVIDSKLARILSDFFSDIAKAYFIATFIAPSLTGASAFELVLLLTKGLVNVILFLVLAWLLSKMEDKNESG